MAQKLTATLPVDLDLGNGYTIRFAALDPSSGAAVAGVTISGAQIHCDNISAVPDEGLEVGPFMLVPGPETS